MLGAAARINIVRAVNNLGVCLLGFDVTLDTVDQKILLDVTV
jgi:hypothetical protein